MGQCLTIKVLDGALGDVKSIRKSIDSKGDRLMKLGKSALLNVLRKSEKYIYSILFLCENTKIYIFDRPSFKNVHIELLE